MATNQKAVYVTDHVSGPGSRTPYKPGDRIDERLQPEVVKGLMERGLATDDAKHAEAASRGEADRRAHVEEQIANRSEKRGASE